MAEVRQTPVVLLHQPVKLRRDMDAQPLKSITSQPGYCISVL